MDQSQSEIVLRRSKRKKAPVNYNYGSSRRSKTSTRRARTTHIYIPNDIVRQILLKVPREFNYTTMTHVCTSWRDAILHDSNFTHSNIKSSTYGLILRNFSPYYKFVEVTTTTTNKLKVKVGTLNCSSSYTMLSTCNGLILAGRARTHNPGPEWTVTLLNPVTNQLMCLPPSSLAPKFSLVWYTLGYAAALGEYKVVKVGVDKFDQTRVLCEILTLGLNQKWRQLHCPLGARAVTHLRGEVYAVDYSVGNYIHCTALDSARLVSLNLENETFRGLPYPDCVSKFEIFLVMEDKLTLITKTADNIFFYDIWVLVEEDGNINAAHWMKLCNPDFRFLGSSLRSIYNVDLLFVSGWLKSMELLMITVFRSPGGVGRFCVDIAYNIRTGEFHEFEQKVTVSHTG